MSPYGPLFALACASIPAFSVASCIPGGKPSYQDISSIYFRSEGVTEPISIHRGDLVQRGACPALVVLYASPNEVDKGGSPYCFQNRAAKVHSCCGATDSSTGDSPQLVFDRLVTVLQQDGFYNMVGSSQPRQSGNAAFYSITVMRCGAQPHNKNISLAFVGSPQPSSNTAMLIISIPFGSLPDAAHGTNILTIFDDLTHAIYQSRWTVEDIW